MGGTGCQDCAHYKVCAFAGTRCGEYMSVPDGALQAACVFNEGVTCSSHDKCTSCGWCPAVQEKRKAQLRQQERHGEHLHVQVQTRNPS